VGPLPPNMPAFNPEVNPYAYDPEKARALLAEAGYPNRFDCVLWTMESGSFRLVAEATVEYLRQAGVRARMVMYDPATYWDKFDEYLTADGREFPTKEGVFDMYLGGWTGGEMAHEFLDPLFRGGSYSNSSFYDNPRVNALLDTYPTLLDPEEHNRVYRELQAILVDDAPWIFASHWELSVGIRKRVKGYRINPAGRYFFEGVRLEDAVDPAPESRDQQSAP